MYDSDYGPCHWGQHDAVEEWCGSCDYRPAFGETVLKFASGGFLCWECGDDLPKIRRNGGQDNG